MTTVSALPFELGSMIEIAKEFDVPRTTASMWAVRREVNGFPEPLVVLGCGPIYDMAAVRHWYTDVRQPARGSAEFWERKAATDG